MLGIGIVAEYDPFHTGHQYHIRETRRAFGEDAAIVAVMSGNWTQRGEPAAAEKHARARLALQGGADLVLELPTPWACASAERFARGSVSILLATGAVNVISFGSECGDAAALQAVADCLDSGAYQAALRRYLDMGKTFAACRQAAAAELMGEERAALLAQPNNNLGVEYLRAVRHLGGILTPYTVQRQGAGHNTVAVLFPGNLSAEEKAARLREAVPYLSASQIRDLLLEGRWDTAEPYLPEGARGILEQQLLSPQSIARMESAYLAKLRTMEAEDWAALPDSGAGEGLPMRLAQAGKACTSLDEFLTLVKTKRYPRARLQRLVSMAFLGIRANELPALPPYIKVLGSNAKGREVLRTMRKSAELPVIVKPAKVRELDAAAQQVFAVESRCTDLYGLFLNPVPPCGAEWTAGSVLTE